MPCKRCVCSAKREERSFDKHAQIESREGKSNENVQGEIEFDREHNPRHQLHQIDQFETSGCKRKA